MLSLRDIGPQDEPRLFPVGHEEHLDLHGQEIGRLRRPDIDLDRCFEHRLEVVPTLSREALVRRERFLRELSESQALRRVP
jgi:hypothetical protein